MFPYLLPNLICAALLFISIAISYFLLQETHPDMQPWSTPEELDNSHAETPLMATAGATANAGVDLRAESYGTFNEVNIEEEQEWNLNADGTSRPASITSGPDSKVFTWKVSMLVVALGIYTYHSMTYDHLLPIFLQDERSSDITTLARSPVDVPGGIGLSTSDVGLIMSVNGIIALVIQAVVFPLAADWLGVWRLFVVATVLHPIAYFIVPYLAWLPEDALYPGIYICLTIRNLFTILVYPVILILLKQASPSPSVLGKINGLAASAGAACRTIAPPIAGLLYSVGIKIGFTGIAWWGSGLVAIVGALQLFTINREKHKTAKVHSFAPCVARLEPEEQQKREVIHILVTDEEEQV